MSDLREGYRIGNLIFKGDIMNWFNKKQKAEKAPKLTPFEIAFQKKNEYIQRLINEHSECWHLNEYEQELVWVKILKDRPKEMASSLNLGRAKLNSIINDLYNTACCRQNRWSGERVSQDYYKLQQVQNLVDYSIGLRYAMDYMMEEAVKRGIAHYDEKGIFHLNELDSEKNND